MNTSAKASKNKPPRRLLICRLSAHGDVLQTLPLLGVLKAADPTLFIGWVVEEAAAPLLKNHPFIDQLHISQRKRWLGTLKHRPWQAGSILNAIQHLLRDIRNADYEASLDVQGLLKSALIPFAAGIPRRLGYARTREHAAWLYTEKLPPHTMTDPNLPTVVKFSEFASYLGFIKPISTSTFIQQHLSFPLAPVPASSQALAAQLAKALPPSRKPRVGLALGTMWSSKTWPRDHWHKLSQLLIASNTVPVLIGGPQEAPLADELTAALGEKGLVSWVGQTQLHDLPALLPHLNVLVGSDSAPLHLANAVAWNSGKPQIVGLFGSTAPGRTGPITKPGHHPHHTLDAQLSCQPCFKRVCPLGTTACMEHLTPERVYEAIIPLLDQPSLMAAEGP